MPRVTDHEQRRGEIVDAAWNLILKGGIEAATMREIASYAGFANGALRHYFPGKEDIVESTFQRALKEMEQYVTPAVAGKTGLAALEGMCWAAMPLDAERVTAGRVLLAFWEMSLSNADLYASYLDHLRGWRAALSGYIKQARSEGDITTPTPDEQLVDEIVLINAGANVMSLIGPTYSTVELQKAHLESFFARLRTA